MARLSRAESQARTREKLLATARMLFLRDGFAATSLDQVAEAAGFSKGAVYSNFAGKEELALAVLEAIRAERVAALSLAVAGAETLDERIAALQKWAEKNIGDRAWTALEVELGVYAARHPELARAFAKRNEALRERAGAVVAALAAAGNRALPLPPEETALTLLSLGIGLGMQRALDPRLSVRVLSDVIRLLAGDARAPSQARRIKTK